MSVLANEKDVNYKAQPNHTIPKLPLLLHVVHLLLPESIFQRVRELLLPFEEGSQVIANVSRQELRHSP